MVGLSPYFLLGDKQFLTNSVHYVVFEVFMAVIMKNAVFLDVARV
jgi:hypothetical protein